MRCKPSGSGIAVPIGRVKLNVAAWTGDAIKCQRVGAAGSRPTSAAMSWYPIDVGVKTPQNALNQNRAEQHAPVTPIRDANITPHANARPTAASAPRSLIMEAPPQWRECDRHIYCRVNVAKPLIAGLAGLAAQRACSIGCAGLMREKGLPRPAIAH